MRDATAEPGREKAMEQLLSLDVIDLLGSIVTAHQEIDVLSLGQPYINVPLLNRPDLVPSDHDLIRTAWQQSMATGEPVWDTVMLSLARSDHVSDTLLNQAMVHHGISETRFALRADGFAGKIRELLENRPPGQILAMCSDVQLKTGETKHIPMIDFRCQISPHSLQLISKIAKLLDVGRAFIVETDRSYHLYGTKLLTRGQWSQFLGRALQFSPIVDRAWIAHQLIDTCCNLRIAPRMPEGKELRVVAVIE